MSASKKWAHVAREAAELAAEVRREPLDQTARVASLEKRRRKQDEPARRAYANQSLALRLFVQFVGYDQSVADVLRAAIEAAAGLDHAITHVDWEMGCYLRGASPDEMARLRQLPARHKDKLALAKAWTRAFAEYEAEEKRTGIVALRRIPGSKDFKTGQQRASQIHALCSQDIAEIAAAATKISGKRFERFARAAAAHVEILRDTPARRAHTKEETEPKPTRIRQADTPALLMVRAISKVEKLADELKRELPPEMRQEARAHLIAALAALDDEAEGIQDTAEAPPCGAAVHLDLKNRKVDKTTEPDPPADCQSAYTENTEANKNAGAGGVVMDNLSTTPPQKTAPPATYETYRKALTFFLDERMRAGASLDQAVAQFEHEIGDFDGWLDRVNSYSRPFSHTCPSPDVDPELITERVYIMCEAGDISETEAAQIARRDLCEVCAEAANIARSHVTELEYAPGKFM
jgi:hypothetical protein